jgi:hypothetical protein
VRRIRRGFNAAATSRRPVVAQEQVRSEWLKRIRAEYVELPGLALTEPQFRRLWGLDSATSRAMIDELVRSGFLKQSAKHGYVRGDSY